MRNAVFAKHALLKPSGKIGVKLGFLGVAMFLAIFLYPLRKHWAWLSRQGSSRHWLDFHVLLGLSAPFVIAFHSAWKFHGFAGIAFWIMLAVSVSGVVGRYLYAQIPRNLNAAEISLKELQELRERLARQLVEQRLLPQADLNSLLRLPSAERVNQLPMVVALIYMMSLDVARVFRVAASAGRRWVGQSNSQPWVAFARPATDRSRKPSRLLGTRPRWPNGFCFSPARSRFSTYGM